MTDSPAKAKAETAGERIRDLIVNGELLPGQQLRQSVLADMLGVSRVPVREALQSLLATGLVRHVPDTGYTVARLTTSELSQVYKLRELLECDVIDAVRSVDPEALAELEALHAYMVEIAPQGSVAEFQRTNLAFHMSIFSLSGLDLIAAEVRRLWVISEPYRALWAQDRDNRERSIAGHADILAALRTGQFDEVRALMQDHRGTLIHEVNRVLAAAPLVL